MTATTATTTGVRHRRPLLPLANLALAGAALTVSVIAVTTDRDPASPNDVTSQDETPSPAQPPSEPIASANANRTATAGDCLNSRILIRC